MAQVLDSILQLGPFLQIFLALSTTVRPALEDSGTDAHTFAFPS